MIQEAYVSFETAKLLKKKGFNEPCWGLYLSDFDENDRTIITQGRWIESARKNSFEDEVFICSAPTQQMAMKWLREVYGLFIQIRIVSHSTETVEQKYYFYSIFKNRREISSYYEKSFYLTYEEAVDAALEYVLENLI